MPTLVFPLLGYGIQHLLLSIVMTVAVLGLLRIRELSARSKARLTLAALVLCVAGPLAPMPETGSAETSATPEYAAVSSPSPPPQPELDGGGHAPVEPRATLSFPVREPVALLLAALWLGGVAWRLARLCEGYRRLRRIVAGSARCPTLEREYAALLPEGVQIRLSDTFGPAAAGVLRPIILVPARLACTLSKPGMRAVLLHESSHVRRRDPLAQLAQRLVESVFWWNPLVRWLALKADATREVACDVEASRAWRAPEDYADALLAAIARLTPACATASAAASAMFSLQDVLERRIDGIVGQRVPEPAARRAACGALAALATVFAIGCAMARSVTPMPAVWPAPDAAMAVAAARPASTEAVAGGAPLAIDRQQSAFIATAAAGPVRAAGSPIQHSPAFIADTAEERRLAYRSATERERLAYAAIAERRRRDYAATTEAMRRDLRLAQEAARAGRDDALARTSWEEFSSASNAVHQAYVADAEKLRRQHLETLAAMEAEYRRADAIAS